MLNVDFIFQNVTLHMELPQAWARYLDMLSHAEDMLAHKRVSIFILFILTFKLLFFVLLVIVYLPGSMIIKIAILI